LLKEYKDKSEIRSAEHPRRNVEKDDWSGNVPAPVPYATAASQHIYGTRSVKAILSAQNRKVYKLYVATILFKSGASKRAEHEEIVKMAEQRGIPVERVDAAFIARLAKPRNVLANSSPVPVHDVSAPYRTRHGRVLTFIRTS